MKCRAEYSDELAIGTERPQRPATTGLVLTTTPGPVACNHGGQVYADGARLPGATPCEHCYCMRGDVVCAVQECGPALSGCTALPTREGACCPEAFQCGTYTNRDWCTEKIGERVHRKSIGPYALLSVD